jgi:hypothetical protein
VQNTAAAITEYCTSFDQENEVPEWREYSRSHHRINCWEPLMLCHIMKGT